MDELFSSGRVALFLVIIIIEVAVFLAAISIPLDPSQQKSLLSEGKQVLSAVGSGTPLETMSGIFLNNFRIALIEAVPFVGPVFLGYSIYYTGQVLEALAVSSDIPPLVLGALTFIFPHALTEFAGYALAATAGLMLIRAAIRRRARSEVRVFVSEVLIAGLILLLAAIIETFEIVSPLVGFSLWLPVALLLVGLALWVRRVQAAGAELLS